MDDWISIGDAAREVVRKIADKMEAAGKVEGAMTDKTYFLLVDVLAYLEPLANVEIQAPGKVLGTEASDLFNRVHEAIVVASLEGAK